MAVAFSKETLRTLQDPVPIYEAVLAKHAAVSSSGSLLSSLPLALGSEHCDLDEILFSEHSLAGIPSIFHTTSLGHLILVQ